MAAIETTWAGSSGGGSGRILGIESSCDETAAAVVERGARQLSNVVASQISIHARYGGVVPELASREHLRAIVPVVDAAILNAGAALDEVGFTLHDLDAIAVTEGPGLAGALMVGIGYAKALAFALSKPLIAVNHLEGHIHAVLLEHAADPVFAYAAEGTAPLLALVVSGGHTHLYLAKQAAGTWQYRNVGHTVDDAAGEAFDKVAKLLGLGYPGGPWIDALAAHGNPLAVPFSFAQIKQKAHRAEKGPPDTHADERRFLFSFSGIKTAVLRYVETHGMADRIQARRRQVAAFTHPQGALPLCDQQTLDLLASFQRAVVDDLKRKTFAAAEHYGAHGLLISGGVAANRELRLRFAAEAQQRGLPIAFPALALATDNAAMIAAAAWPKLAAGTFAPADLTASASLTLGARLTAVP